MTLLRKNLAVYAMLALTWGMLVVWLAFEHHRAVQLAREKVLNRGRTISNTIAVISRSGWQRLIRQSQLEESLRTLTSQQAELSDAPLISVALLNLRGEIVVQSGPSLDRDVQTLASLSPLWEDHKVTVVNPVEFGTIAGDEATTGPLAVVLPSGDEPMRDGRRDRDRDGDRDGDRRRDGDGPRGPRGMGPPPTGDPRTTFRRPPWMSQEQYDQLLAKQGLHGFVLVLSTVKMQEDIHNDLWMRLFVGGIGLLAVGALGLAWRSRENSTGLQLRLMRAQELNTHLQEMNLAAAGLAHETRNPLNIVRGLAQMIARRDEVPPDIRDRSSQITEEVDRVTVRLNEFINYSKPPEPRPAPTDALAVARDVARALESDAHEKKVSIGIDGPTLSVMADESLLRQVLFNLILNAIQAVGEGGIVTVAIQAAPRGEATLSVDDNGPGVPEEIQPEIFRPYFTTTTQGTGLGLAVVRQIVLAHRWEIEYAHSPHGGASFRICGMKVL